MSRSKRFCLVSFLFIFIFLNLLLIGSGNADEPSPFVVNGPDHMSINQTATLSVSGGCGAPYTWEINSGGGSLSNVTDTSVTYTAPSSNPNCDLNPLISVTDKAGQIVYKQIAVNASAYKGHAGRVKRCHREYSCTNGSKVPNYNLWDYNVSCALVWISYVGCDGIETSYSPSQVCAAGGNGLYKCGQPDCCSIDGCKLVYGSSCEEAALSSRGWGGGWPCNHFPGSLNEYIDLRDETTKAAGCCPPSSIPSPPPPVTVTSCCDLKITDFTGSSTTINRDSGGKITFTAAVTSSKPFNWTFTVAGNTINGTGNPVSVEWDGMDSSDKVVDSGTYTATLSVQEADNPTCKDEDTKSFKVAAREKDCKLDVTFDSSLNIASGNLSHSQNLFTVPNSGLMSDFTVYYNSMEGYDGILGKGWTHTYNVFLTTDPTDDAYILSDGRGGMISLYKNGDYYTSDISVYPMLKANADSTFTLTYKNGSVYSFNTNGKLTSISDKNGNTVHLTYSSGGNLVNITDPAGKVIYLSYDGSNRINAITDPNNNSYAFTYSGNNLASVSSHNSLGTQTWQYTYDSLGFMLTKADPQGNLVQYSYDTEHRVIHTIDPQGYARNIQYDPENKTTTVMEKDGGAWIYKYDPVLGALNSKTDPNGGTTYYQYDASRNLTAKTEPDGTSTSYTYDQSGNMLSVTDALNNTTTYTYNDQNLVTSITDAAGRQTSYTYDANGNILSTTDPAGSTTRYTYDSKGNIIAITDPVGGVTQMAYDANNNLISMTSPTGQTTSQTYDNLGNMTSQIDAAGNQTTFQYNSLNQLIAVTDSAGQTSRYTYDTNGNRLSVTDTNGNTTTYEYNHKNQLVKTTDALGETTTFAYGSGGCSSCGGGSDKLTAVTDAKNHTTTYQYDQLGRLIKETDPLGNSITYAYDAKGNMVSKTKPDGRTINYVYDALNRLSERSYPNGTSDVFQYDAAGNLAGTTNANVAYYFSYDANNRMTGVTSYNLAQLFNIEYQYDIMGNRTKMTMKEGTSTPRVINYEYNVSNQMTKIISDTTGTYTFVYDALGRRVKRTLPNDSYTTYTYDQLSRLTDIAHKNAFNHTIDSFSYTHDPVGNRLTKTIKEGMPHTINYNYDKVYRLTKASPYSRNKLEKLFDDIVSHHTEAYSYDPVGNRHTGPDKFDSYTYNNGNELLTSTEHPHQNTQNEYDVNGNLIKKTETIQNKAKLITSYTYDDENRLIYVTIAKGAKTKEISFAYDPFGRRISKTIEKEEFTDDDDKDNGKDGKDDKDNHHENDKDGHHDEGGHHGNDKDHHGKHGHNDYPKTTFYIYDNQNIIAEYDENNKQTASYVYGPNIDEPLSADINNTRVYYHADGLGSITTLTNHMGHKVQQYDYDSFGNIKSTPFWIKQPYTYTGREFDYDTNLYYYRARYYDPQAGRFMTRDPIGFESGDYNLYVYVKNNSINYTDPEGLKTYMCKKFLHALGGKGQRTGPDIWGNPLYHQYICVIKSDGTPICGGQDRTGGAWSRGTPSQDYYSPENCTQTDLDNECLEQCLINAIKSPKRPYYGLLGPGTNCQEWADDTYNTCKSQWR